MWYSFTAAQKIPKKNDFCQKDTQGFEIRLHAENKLLSLLSLCTQFSLVEMDWIAVDQL